jgi:HEPN domain-containing protein
MNGNELVAEWFVHSYNDYISAKHLFENMYPRQIDIACYLTQQCAETALKGYLQFMGIEPPKIHNLLVLCQSCIGHDADFSFIADPCADLNKYSNLTRYPNELENDEASAKSAIEKAKIIYEFCLGKVPEDCRPKEVSANE